MDPENPGLEMAKAFAEGAGKESTNKLAEFIGGFFPFFGLKKKSVDTYVHDIQQSNMSPEAKMIAIASAKKTFRELKNQSAIINVAYEALDSGQNINVDALSSADDELISRLIDSGKYVSDEDLQLLWGNVLAGELETPGSIPKNVVRILSELSKEYAIVFSNLCSLRADILADTGTEIHRLFTSFFIDKEERNYLTQMNLHYRNYEELDRMGLIYFSPVAGYACSIPHEVYPYIHIVCGGEVITVYNENIDFPCGCFKLTSVGESISRFAPPKHNLHHIEAIRAYLNSKNIHLSPTPGIRITRMPKETGIRTGYSYERLPIVPPQTQEQK